MTVADLIALLQDRNPNALVVHSKDAEGNDYSPVEEITGGYYHPETTWSGEFSPTDDYPEEPNAVCLWPVN